MTDHVIRASELETLAKDIGPDLGMFIAQWAAQQQLGVEQEALSTLVVRRVRAKLRALISSAREEGEPSGCTCPDGYPSSNECPLHGDEVHRDPPSSASTHLCPNKHGAEHEMELVWYCETCGNREPATAGTEGRAEIIRRGLEEAMRYLNSDYPEEDDGLTADKANERARVAVIDAMAALGEGETNEPT